MSPFFSTLLLTLGCAPNEEAPPTADDACDVADGPTQVAVISTMAFARQEDGVAVGFDLDGHETTVGDAEGCGVGDYVAPDGTPGIDSAINLLLPVLDNTEAQAVEQILQLQIDQGELLLLIELTDVEDAVEDTCVNLHMLRGLGEPLLGTDSRILPNQTFERALDLPDAWAPTQVLTDGVLERGGPVDLNIPADILDAHVEFNLVDGFLRAELREDGGMSGWFAGGVDMAELLRVATDNGVAAEVADALNAVASLVTDLDPDGDGVCTHLSITFQFEAVRAFLFDDP